MHPAPTSVHKVGSIVSGTGQLVLVPHVPAAPHVSAQAQALAQSTLSQALAPLHFTSQRPPLHATSSQDPIPAHAIEHGPPSQSRDWQVLSLPQMMSHGP